MPAANDPPDADGNDPLARRFSDARGEHLARVARYGMLGDPAAGERRAAFDERLLRLIERDRVDTVLLLTAGLDTRCYRLPLPPWLRWIEADEPAILAYKTERLADLQPHCTLERLPLDLADVAGRNTLFAHVNQAAERVLLVSEGCLAYLVPERVALIAQDLHAQPHFRWWLLDLLPPRALQGMPASQGGGRAAERPALRFAPPEGPAFFARHGWLVAEVRPLRDDARPPKPERRPARSWPWFPRVGGAGRSADADVVASMVRLERG